MLQNERVVAKIGFDTAENELSKVWVISNQPTTLLDQKMFVITGCSYAYCVAASY